MVGGRGPEVILEYQIALGGRQLGESGSRSNRLATPRSLGETRSVPFSASSRAIARRTSAANIFSFRLLIFLTSSEAPTLPGPAL